MKRKALGLNGNACGLVPEEAHGEEFAADAAVLALGFEMDRVEGKAGFLFNARQNLRVDADVILEAERAVVAEDLGELAFGVDHRLFELDVVGAFRGGHGSSGKEREADGKQSLLEHL